MKLREKFEKIIIEDEYILNYILQYCLKEEIFVISENLEYKNQLIEVLWRMFINTQNELSFLNNTFTEQLKETLELSKKNYNKYLKIQQKIRNLRDK